MMIFNFPQPLRWCIYFLVGFCGALMLAIASFSAPDIAPAQSAPVASEFQAQPPMIQSGLEASATHQEPNFYQ